MTAAALTPLPAKGSSQFVSVAGTSLPLPADAHPNLAYLWEESFSTSSTSVAFSYTVPGKVYEIPLLLHTTWQGPIGGGSGPAFFAVAAKDGTALWQIATSDDISGTTPADVLFQAGTATAWSRTDKAFFVAYIGGVLLPPGTPVSVSGPDPAGATGWDNSFSQSIRIPSGGKAEPPPAPSRPSLLLV